MGKELSDAPKGTILELFLTLSWQPCHGPLAGSRLECRAPLGSGRTRPAGLTGTNYPRVLMKERYPGLPANAIFAPRIRDSGDNPVTIRTSKSEQVRPAVIHLAIH